MFVNRKLRAMSACFKPQVLKNNPSKNLYPFSDSCDQKYAPFQT